MSIIKRYICYLWNSRTLSKLVVIYTYFVCITLLSLLISISISKSKDPTLNTSKDNLNQEQHAGENYLSKMSVAETVRPVPRHQPYKQGMKSILFWSPLNYDPLYYLKEKGQEGFINNKCAETNCYVTDDRQFFGHDVDKFDAIIFNGQVFKNLYNKSLFDIPQLRSPHQRYIFYEMQSAGDNIICTDALNDFFNWTMTYKLDSDIPCPFIVIKNRAGQVVGPKINMQWVDGSSTMDIILAPKKKAVAWFPTHCTRSSQKTFFASRLRQALGAYKLDVDIYGDCGPLACVMGNKECDYIKRDYFYYLALENSEAEDYVTEKLLTAVQNEVVPIVMGGSDYSRFLPPGSYLDGTKMTPEQMAAFITSSLTNPQDYKQFFRWRKFYKYSSAVWTTFPCFLCAALNNEVMLKQYKVYKDFRKWWNPDYKDKCTEEVS